MRLRNDIRFWFGLSAVIALLFFALLAPWIAPYDPMLRDIKLRLAAPSSEHLLGCDLNGGDIVTDLIYGAKVSLYVGLITVALCTSLGTLVGLVSGYRGGWVDLITMRIVDILLAFPGILVAMVMASILGPSLHNVIVAISVTGWISSARLVRGQVLALKTREHVLAAKALGASESRILRLHLLPLIFAPLLVHATFSLAGVILVEASLSFLGLSSQTGAPSWGALLSQGKSVLMQAPRVALFPGLAILWVVLGVNLLGEALRDKWDPKYYRRK